MIDFEPSDEQALIIETVRQFAANEIRPHARSADEAGASPPSILDAAHSLGLVANALPEAHGGGGERSAMTGVLIAEELGWGDMAIALAILSPGLLGLPIGEFGSESLQNEVIPTLLDNAFAPGSLAISEPRFDFDVFHPQTTAKSDGDEHILDGLKCRVPWIDGVRHVVVIASEPEGLGAYVVACETTGLGIEPELKMGLCGLPTVELTLSGVRVPKAARLAADDSAIRCLLDRGRLALAATAIGAARAAFEASRDYAKERETFGQPIATRQAIAFKLADMAIEIDGARLLIWEAAAALDRGETASRLARLAYDQTTRITLEVADGAVQVFGGHGYIRDYLPELHLRNLAGLASFEALALV